MGMMGPNGPMPMLPPNHPIMMEMQALHHHLGGLYKQPESPQTQAKIAELQARMRELQNQMTQMTGPPPQGWGGGPMDPRMMGPGGPPGGPMDPRMMGPGGPGMPPGPQPQDPFGENFEEDEFSDGKKKRQK